MTTQTSNMWMHLPNGVIVGTFMRSEMLLSFRLP